MYTAKCREFGSVLNSSDETERASTFAIDRFLLSFVRKHRLRDPAIDSTRHRTRTSISSWTPSNDTMSTNGVAVGSRKSETKRPAEVFETEVPLPSGEFAIPVIVTGTLLSRCNSEFSPLLVPRRRRNSSHGRTRLLYVTRNAVFA